MPDVTTDEPVNLQRPSVDGGVVFFRAKRGHRQHATRRNLGGRRSHLAVRWSTATEMTLPAADCVAVGDEVRLVDPAYVSFLDREVRAVVLEVMQTPAGKRMRVRLLGDTLTIGIRKAVGGILALVAVSAGMAFLTGGLRDGQAASRASLPDKANASVTKGVAGPWGQLEYTRIDIEPPRDLVRKITSKTTRWFFGAHSRQQVVAALRDAEIPPGTIDRCVASGLWTSTPSGTALEPPGDVVLTLQARSRQKLYGVLARFPENQDQRSPIPVSPRLVDNLSDSGVSTDTIARFRGVLYGSGPWHLFADLPAILASLPNDEQRIRFATVVLRAESYLVRLLVNEHASVDELTRYWSPGENTEDVRPLLESLTRVPGGARMGIVKLLPSFVRAHVNRYPHGDDPVESRADCFWSSLTFLDGRTGRTGQPPIPVDDPDFVLGSLRSNFHPTSTAPQLGNLVVLLNQSLVPVHAAVFIADDLVFTKNGQGVVHPWTFMSMKSMIALYTSLQGPLRVVTVTDARSASPAAANAMTRL